MFVRYLGGGIGHGGNTTDIETPVVPDDEPDDGPDNQPEGGPDKQPSKGHGKESDNGATSESEDEDVLDDEHAVYGDGDAEDEYSDDEPSTEL
jgi:hypothetical protein